MSGGHLKKNFKRQMAEMAAQGKKQQGGGGFNLQGGGGGMMPVLPKEKDEQIINNHNYGVGGGGGMEQQQQPSSSSMHGGGHHQQQGGSYLERIEGVARQNIMIHNLEDNFLGQEALENLRELQSMLPYDEEEILQEEEEKELIAENLERQQQQSEYSKRLFELEESIYVPWHCNRVVRSSNHVEVGAPLSISKGIPEWRPSTQDIALAFGSRTNYAQGLNVEKLQMKDGNMNNTYLLYLGIQNIRNDFPCPVGVTFGEYSSEGNLDEWIPLDNRSKIYGGQEFHAILPPRSKLAFPQKDVVCMKSTSEINHYYSRKFPSFFAGNLHEGIKQTGWEMCLIPCNSPVMDFIFRNMNKFGWPKPTLGMEESTEGFFIVDQKVTKEALKMTKEVFNKFLKITNLDNLTIRFHKLDKSLLNKNDVDLEMNREDFNHERIYGVTFELNSVHVFKDNYKDLISLEPQEKDTPRQQHHSLLPAYQPQGGGNNLRGGGGQPSYMAYSE